MSEAADRHCLDLVRAGDKDRYLASLFAPDDKRPHLIALYAFNHEIARVRETVSEPQLGEIRFRWWLDALDSLYRGETAEHPVAEALSRAIEAGGLPQRAFANLIEARRFDLYDDPMPTVNDLEGYLGETSSVLIQMAALILAGPDAQGAAEAAGLAGVAYGLAGLLRALPIHRARGQCYIPKNVLADHGLKPAHLLAGRPEEGLGKTLYDVLRLARGRLDDARGIARQIPRHALPAFLPVSLVQPYLARLAKFGTRALTEVADISQLARQWRLYRAAWTNRF